MPHPYFDRLTIPWDRPEVLRLQRALAKEIGDRKRIQGILQNCGLQWDEGSRSAHQTWRDGLDALAKMNFFRLLNQHVLKSDFPESYAALLEIVEAKDTFAELFPRDMPFVDRTRLRDKLGAMSRIGSGAGSVGAAGAGVLIVRGERGSGRSHTRELVADHAHHMGELFVIVDRDLASGAEEAMRLIFGAFGKPMPTRLQTEDAWYRAACGQMVQVASDLQRRCWVVADDLATGPDGSALVNQQLRDLLDQMVLTSMAHPIFARWFRLVLIDYPADKPTRWKGMPPEDVTSLADFSETVLTELCEKLAERRGGVLSKEDATRVAAQALQSYDRAIGARDLFAKLEIAMGGGT